jgi:hypothetical protein
MGATEGVTRLRRILRNSVPDDLPLLTKPLRRPSIGLSRRSAVSVNRDIHLLVDYTLHLHHIYLLSP